MTRRIEEEAGSLIEAVRAAVASLAGCEPEKVDLRIDAPGLVEVTGARVILELETATEAEEPEEEPAEESWAAGEADEEESGEDEEDEGAAGTAEGRISVDELDEEATAAADFLEGLLDILELPGDLQIRVLEDRAEVEIVGMDSGLLIGRHGQTLDSLQELVRCAMQRRFERRSRVKVDIEGYRQGRLEKYLEDAAEAVRTARDSGEAQRLEPMDSFDRKAVHHRVAEEEGVTSYSEGREPNRRVVIEAAE